jgi:hypothetical protein
VLQYGAGVEVGLQPKPTALSNFPRYLGTDYFNRYTRMGVWHMERL